MADFTLEDLTIRGYPTWVEVPEPIWQWEDEVRCDFTWWCLSHNFDVVGAIISMAHLSWQSGWNSRDLLYRMWEENDNVEPNSNPDNR